MIDSRSQDGGCRISDGTAAVFAARTSFQCPGTSESGPMRQAKSPWPMATHCLPPISSSIRHRRHMARPASCRIRPGRKPHRSRPLAGTSWAFRATLPRSGSEAAAEALIVFTSPGAQKLYVQNGSRTNPRYSVGADPEVRRASPIFEAVDQMSWRDELQFWPRPPIPEIGKIFQICGEELHDMLRGIIPPKTALQNAQKRAEQAMREQHKT
jgi:hypothetical protein